jgi:S1-C subfamily serine protease
MDGDVIGINPAIFSRSGSSSGVGFAVPASMVRRVVDSALGGATAVVRPWLGVKGDSVSAEIARSLGLARPQGLIVTDVYPGGPGARAGLREGDVITALDGAEINDQAGLNFRVGTRDPNDSVAVTLLRDGRSQTVNARVQALPGKNDRGPAVAISGGPLAGLVVASLSPAEADVLANDAFAQIPVVTSVSGRAANWGFQEGDLIIGVNGRPVGGPQLLGQLGGRAQVTIQRNGRRLTGVVS